MIRFSNNVSTALTTAVNSTQTEITVTDASKFPTLNEGDSTYCTLVDAFNAQWLEICEVTAISGNTLTIRRGIEGTSPRDFNVGAKCELRLTAELLTRAITEMQHDRIDGNVTVIQLKRDDIDGLSPSPNANSFDVGELVYNTTTGDLWSKLDSGEITQLGGPNYIPDDAPYGGPQIYGRRNGEWTAIPFPSTFVSDLPPTILNPDDGSVVDMPTGSMWYDTGTTSELYVWDGTHWVSMTGIDSDGGGGAVPDNVTTDDFQQQNIDKALVRIHPQSGNGYWRPISTSDVNTEPDVTFRDEKGRFKSTDQYEDLTDQLKVNRFLALELENQTETIADEAAMRRSKDDQLQAEITALAEVVSEIEAPEIPEVDLSDYATIEYVDQTELNVLNAAIKVAQDGDKVLQDQIDALDWDAVVVSDDPPDIEDDGQLWYDSNRLELFVSYQDAWISTSPLESRIEAGEALQAEILGRVEAGEVKQASIETSAMTKGGAQTLTADNWSLKDDGGATYAMISDGEITMYHVATPGAPKQPTNKEYVDKVDNELKRRIDELESMVAELGGVIVRYRYVYNSEKGNARLGTFNIKSQEYAATKNVNECRYIEFNATDADGKQPSFPNVKDRDLVRIVGPSGERVDYINDGNMDETPVLLIDGSAFSDFDEFAEGSQYTVTIVGAK